MSYNNYSVTINYSCCSVIQEPEYAAAYEACVWTAESERDFIKYYLGIFLFFFIRPVYLQLANYYHIRTTNHERHPSVNIMIYDHNKDHIFILVISAVSFII